ncbi:hypothetical protein A7X12_22410 [Sphingomonas sp. TDK1]|nr:hypothetical protein A7X12_22410 [Sphingomonas sp. TDK1]
MSVIAGSKTGPAVRYSTLQDRLVKAMRLKGISTIAGANRFLPSYLAQHNARFACMPADVQDAHRPLGLQGKVRRS